MIVLDSLVEHSIDGFCIEESCLHSHAVMHGVLLHLPFHIKGIVDILAPYTEC